MDELDTLLLLPAERAAYFRLVLVCLLILVVGALGGIAGGIYRYKCKHEPFLNRWRDAAIFSASGAVCAFGMVFLSISLGSLFAKSDSFTNGFYIISLSLLSGFFAMQLLPRLGDQMEKRFDELNKKTDEIEKQTKEAKTYNQLLSMATTALSTNNPADVEEAIVYLSKDIKLFYWDRSLNILLGRLYRRSGKLNEAINVLRNFVREQKKLPDNPAKKEAMGVAFFNIACYHVLRANGDSEEDRLLDEAEVALTSAFKYSPESKNDALTDPDLDFLRKKRPHFLES